MNTENWLEFVKVLISRKMVQMKCSLGG